MPDTDQLIRPILVHWELTYAAALRALALIDTPAAIELALRLRLEIDLDQLRLRSDK